MLKKQGFTLMEILLCVGIIGILAAILMRVLSGVMPDIDKASFVRAYLTTRTVVSDMINDSSIYSQEPDANGEYAGFSDTDAPKYGKYYGTIYSGANKFPLIFKDKVGLDGSGFSNRDGVYYSVGTDFTITIKNKDGDALGTFTVGSEGSVSCSSSLGYCDDITNFRRKMD